MVNVFCSQTGCLRNTPIPDDTDDFHGLVPFILLIDIRSCLRLLGFTLATSGQSRRCKPIMDFLWSMTQKRSKKSPFCILSRQGKRMGAMKSSNTKGKTGIFVSSFRRFGNSRTELLRKISLGLCVSTGFAIIFSHGTVALFRGAGKSIRKESVTKMKAFAGSTKLFSNLALNLFPWLISEFWGNFPFAWIKYWKW